MRKVFRHKDLYELDEYGDNFYSPIFLEIFSQNCKLYKITPALNLEGDSKEIRIRRNLSYGLCDFSLIHRNIDVFNLYFHQILCEGGVLVAFPLIRMQIDNLCAIYLETIYPFEILCRIFEKGMELSSIKRNQKYINLAKVRQDIDAEFGTNISELYKKYSGFIHPSSDQQKVRIKTYYSYKAGDYIVPQKDLKMYAQDMVAVNQAISDVLHNHINKLKELNKTNKLK